MSQILFETPENIQVGYRPAGMGTRFIAWSIDYFFVILFVVSCMIMLLFTAASVGNAIEEAFEQMDPPEPGQLPQFPLYFIGIIYLVFGFGSFAYFFTLELFLRGQTLGKRIMGIRVVKEDGFSLDPLSIFVRNIFRLADQMPVLWIVPVLSKRSQRFGDMVGGTVVVADELETISDFRQVLSQRSLADSKYRFDATALNKLREGDIRAVEEIVERWRDLTAEQREAIGGQLVTGITKRLAVEAPDPTDRGRFLEDLLVAVYQRQYRKLG
ncbi:MAG: RDD family protein [Planctomycetota bacterium]